MTDYDKRLFLTPGPAQLTGKSASHLRTAFGRGDDHFAQQSDAVGGFLQKITGQNRVISLQGSGSLANQVMVENFLFGKVLVVDSGFYSRRLYLMAQSAEHVTSVDLVSMDQAGVGAYDWVLGTSVETGKGTLVEIRQLRALADRLGAELALDGVASVGLEAHHELADVVGFSSCKGLFGLTGACFVASKEPPTNTSSSFYLSYATHSEKSVTGPYNQMQSIFGLIGSHESLLSVVQENKQILLRTFASMLNVDLSQQPLITTAIRGDFTSELSVVRYRPRNAEVGVSVLSSLGYLENKDPKKNPYLTLKPRLN